MGSFLGSFSLASLHMRFSIRCFFVLFFFHKYSKFCKYYFSTLLSNGTRWLKYVRELNDDRGEKVAPEYDLPKSSVSCKVKLQNVLI